MKALIAIVVVVVIYLYYRSKERDKQDEIRRHNQERDEQVRQAYQKRHYQENKDIYDQLYGTGQQQQTKRRTSEQSNEHINQASLQAAKRARGKQFEAKDVATFARAFHGVDAVGADGDLYMAPMTDGRVHGAMMTISKEMLANHRHLIQSGEVVRDNELRYKAFVPGMDEVRDEKVQSPDGQTYSLWHRTHLVPFRFALSDGDIDGIMFAGTAHVNHGDRPNYMFHIDKYIQEARGNELFARYFHNKKTHPLYLDGPKILVNEEFAPAGTQYSLDDLEQVACHIIEAQKFDLFRYGVMCHYNDDNLGLIPDWVEVHMVNVTKHQTAMHATLQNRY